ncbi:hypothetical protein [Arthrobacter sp. SX1312]|uniref:hypothetical protein n=1 Tax=Arthrobacter sp. SX1312 TaxID=2058896 RepID=UPI0011B07D6F|nr:hypothetical protein [Arthrobacter sp. SX1312]
MLTNTLQPHGLNLHEPGALTKLFALRRATLGDARMDNGDGTGGDTGGTGTGAGGDNGSGGNGSDTDTGFPANTSVKDMKPEEQSAYWRHQARKHEDRVKAYGDLTPEQARQLKKDIEDSRTKSLTEQERAVEEAKEAGRAEVRSVLGQERARNAFEKALAGRTVDPGAMLGLNLGEYIDGDKAKTDEIKKWVTENSTESSKQDKQRFPFTGQGNREQASSTPGDAGRAEAARRFKKKD